MSPQQTTEAERSGPEDKTIGQAIMACCSSESQNDEANYPANDMPGSGGDQRTSIDGNIGAVSGEGTQKQANDVEGMNNTDQAEHKDGHSDDSRRGEDEKKSIGTTKNLIEDENEKNMVIDFVTKNKEQLQKVIGQMQDIVEQHQNRNKKFHKFFVQIKDTAKKKAVVQTEYKSDCNNTIIHDKNQLAGVFMKDKTKILFQEYMKFQEYMQAIEKGREDYVDTTFSDEGEPTVLQKAWDLVEGAISLQTDDIQIIAQDDIVLLAERLLQTQKEFREKNIPYFVDIAYHHTKSENLRTIRTDGLLSRTERQERQIVSNFNGRAYGDGIYCSIDPMAHAYCYGDVTIMHVRMRGKDSYSSSNNINTLVVPEKRFCVLKSCNQCIPLFYFPSELLRKETRYDRMEILKKIADFHKKVQHNLLDKIFNGNEPTLFDPGQFPCRIEPQYIERRHPLPPNFTARPRYGPTGQNRFQLLGLPAQYRQPFKPASSTRTTREQEKNEASSSGPAIAARQKRLEAYRQRSEQQWEQKASLSSSAKVARRQTRRSFSTARYSGRVRFNSEAVDLTNSLIKEACYTCNGDSRFPMQNLLTIDNRSGCKSKSNQQIILHFEFRSWVRIHSMKITEFIGVHSDQHPRKILCYRNAGRDLGFKDLIHVKPTTTLNLTRYNLDRYADKLILKDFAKEDTQSITLFVEENFGGRRTSIGKLKFYGHDYMNHTHNSSNDIVDLIRNKK